MRHRCLSVAAADPVHEWECPDCGYHFVVAGTERVVLNQGDGSLHYGSTLPGQFGIDLPVAAAPTPTEDQ